MSEPVTLPKLLTLDVVAEALDVSTYTVKREIKRGKLRVTKIGCRSRIRDDDLLDYLDQGRTETCQGNEATDPASSETTGSPSGETRRCGAAPGSTPKLDKSAAHRSAQTIFKRPNCDSPNGSSKTSA